MSRLALLAAGLVLLCITPSVAQDAVLGQRYGMGVHAYFSQNFQEAYDDLSSAISAGSRDPRCYYFRGLSYLRLGREEDAQIDFQRGAELETRDVNKFYNVPAALERIQGADRALLERYRSGARLAALQREEQQRAARYGQEREQERRLLESGAAPAGAPPAAAVRANEQPGVFEPARRRSGEARGAPCSDDRTAGGRYGPKRSLCRWCGKGGAGSRKAGCCDSCRGPTGSGGRQRIRLRQSRCPRPLPHLPSHPLLHLLLHLLPHPP